MKDMVHLDWHYARYECTLSISNRCTYWLNSTGWCNRWILFNALIKDEKILQSLRVFIKNKSENEKNWSFKFFKIFFYLFCRAFNFLKAQYDWCFQLRIHFYSNWEYQAHNDGTWEKTYVLKNWWRKSPTPSFKAVFFFVFVLDKKKFKNPFFANFSTFLWHLCYIDTSWGISIFSRLHKLWPWNVFVMKLEFYVFTSMLELLYAWNLDTKLIVIKLSRNLGNPSCRFLFYFLHNPRSFS